MADLINSPVTLSLDTDKLAEEWAKITVEHLIASEQKMVSGAALGDLMRSIKKELAKNGGHIEEVLVKFLKYGRFYDMRVGRGAALGTTNRRKKKRWFSKTYYSEVQRFKELYAEMFQRDIPTQITEALSANVTMSV